MYFDLEDYNKLEKSLNSATKKTAVKEKVEEELEFNLRTEEPIKKETKITKKEELSPLHLTISELQNRSQDRKEKMKQFNYKFNNKLNQNIDEIEREPAYKRMGVELDETILSSETTQSKTSLGVDENDDLQLRSNNSFLHDNVD